MSRQQKFECRQQRHEHGAAVALTERFQLLTEGGGQNQRFYCASVCLHWWPGPVCRQVQNFGRSCKLFLPVTDLSIESFSLQPLPLPHCIVGVLCLKFS